MGLTRAIETESCQGWDNCDAHWHGRFAGRQFRKAPPSGPLQATHRAGIGAFRIGLPAKRSGDSASSDTRPLSKFGDADSPDQFVKLPTGDSSI